MILTDARSFHRVKQGASPTAKGDPTQTGRLPCLTRAASRFSQKQTLTGEAPHSSLRSLFLEKRYLFTNMISHLVDEAVKKVGSTPLLVNIISKRVRQLTAGSKPMIDVLGRMGLADIALKEIIEGKLTYEAKPKEQA